MFVSLSGTEIWPPETNRKKSVFEFSYLCVNSSVEELIKIKAIQTLTIKDCKGPQTNMPKMAGSIKT